jgi:hypothetical protein
MMKLSKYSVLRQCRWACLVQGTVAETATAMLPAPSGP